MKNSTKKIQIIFSLLVILTAGTLSFAQTSSFTFQGRLNDNSLAANGSYQMQFSLYDAVSGGTQISSTSEFTDVSVINGIFTVRLDFGSAAFDGNDRFIEIAVRRNSSESYTTLAPRQFVTSVPYSVRANKSATADVATNANNADTLDGIDSSEFVRGNVVRSFNGRTGDTGIAAGNNVSLTTSSSSNFVRIDVNAVSSITRRYSSQFPISGNNIQKFIMTCPNGFPISGGYVMLGAVDASGSFAPRFELLHSGPAFEDPSQWVVFIQNTTSNTGVGYYYVFCAVTN